jgi:HD-GYP domain-containing protein (c-di-GMP phosphodiesterase class II)
LRVVCGCPIQKIRALGGLFAMWTLTIRSPQDELHEYVLKPGVNTLGRKEGSDICVIDESSSRSHAELLYYDDADKVIIKDLGSTNGTFVNGRRITKSHTLQHEDQVRIGNYVINLRSEESTMLTRLPQDTMHTRTLSRDLVLESLDRHAVLLYEAARQLNTVSDLDTALSEVSKLVEHSMGAKRCVVIMADEFDQLGERNIPASIANKVIEQRMALVIPNAQADPTMGKSATLFGIRSTMCVPVMTDEVVIAIIYVYKTLPQSNPFNTQDLKLAVAISHQAALTIQRARQIERLHGLRTLAMAFVKNLDQREIINTLLDLTVTQLYVDAAAVLLFDQQNQTLEYVTGKGISTEGYKNIRLQLGEGLAGRVASERQMVKVPDLSEGQEESLDPWFEEEGFVSYHAAPLIAKGRVKGVLEIFHRKPRITDPAWLEFLETLAGQAAIAIDNAELYRSLERTNRELELAYDTTLAGWAYALDLRDKETEYHTRRVTEMTVRLASALEVSESELEHVRRGAMLHDIGKMGIPDGILLKPGELIEEEWAIMRKHPQYAYEMLSSIEYLRPALEIPSCHHERWDGEGYPYGLKGAQIPLAARIFAVVDVWDALRSDRPYRDAWSAEKTKEYILAQAGTHFDPQIVDFFLSQEEFWQSGDIPGED